MNKFYYYYNPVCEGYNSPTVFANDPYVNAIKEMFISEIQQLVFYIQKLKSMNIDMSVYTDKVIEFISILIVNLDFQKESFFIIFEDLYNNKLMLKKMYISACEKEEIQPEILASDKDNLSSNDVILKILNEKEKKLELKTESKEDSLTKKYLYEIIISLVLNACNCLIELKKYNINFTEGKNCVLNLLNQTNFPLLSTEEIQELIKSFSACNYQIMNRLYDAISDKFGNISMAAVMQGKQTGKAILVSGASLESLDKILSSINGLNINVYTHNGMIQAFKYEYFKNNVNLKGHYQNFGNNYSLDFASFPGPIFITGNSTPKIDIIRGQIYTSAKYPALGIAAIENDDYSPIIKYALDSKGFEENSDSDEIIIGYNLDIILEKLNLIIDKILEKEISNIFIIGHCDELNKNNEYIKELIESTPEDIYIISFSYDLQRKNFLFVDSAFDFKILYKTVEKIFKEIPKAEDKLAVFLVDCNRETVSHIFNLIYLKVKNIFLGQCCPNIIKPLLLNGLTDLYGIKLLQNPKEDIKTIKKD